jgi:hypothetical protein
MATGRLLPGIGDVIETVSDEFLLPGLGDIIQTEQEAEPPESDSAAVLRVITTGMRW